MSRSTYHHRIDPWFINERLAMSAFGSSLREPFMDLRKPGDDHLSVLANRNLLTDLTLALCKGPEIPSLGEILTAPKPKPSPFCSTEVVAPCPHFYDLARARNHILLPYDVGRNVVLEYHTNHFVADTGKLRMYEGGTVSIVAGVEKISDEAVSVVPLILGGPCFDHPENGVDAWKLNWFAKDLYQIAPSNIAEFARIEQEPVPEPKTWKHVMRKLPEAEVKASLCSILSDSPSKDWGGEMYDHFSAGVHVGEERVTAAFLLKGPARFREMTPEMLGKRADQIFRLSQSSAQVLIVQHCHDIGDAVRSTLRAFSATPHKPRRYCFIDGRDTYRLLRAYGKLP